MEFTGIWDKGMTDMTDRREKNVKQRIEELLDVSHLEPHVFVDYQHMEVGKAWFAINDGGYPTEPVRRVAIAAKAG